MTAVPKPYLTPEEYLVRERAAPYKSEYYRGETFAMAGATYDHNRVKDNLIRFLGNALDGSGCLTVSSDQRVLVSATGLYTYPDVAIVCGPAELMPGDDCTLLNPRVLVEVLSDSTEAYDRGAKFAQYRRLASFQEYVLVAQDRVSIERHVRQPDGRWTMTEFADPAGTFALETVPAAVPVADVYRGVALPDPPPR